MQDWAPLCLSPPLLGENDDRATEGSITVKINRGSVSAWYFLAALNAIGGPQVRLEDV
jgi:hypothetical protein